jgi:hypothetical protein
LRALAHGFAGAPSSYGYMSEKRAASCMDSEYAMSQIGG